MKKHCNVTLAEALKDEGCQPGPAGLRSSVTLAWMHPDTGEPIFSREVRFSDEPKPTGDDPTAYPVTLPLTTKQAFQLADELHEQFKRGNNIENIKIIPQPGGYKLDPDTLV